MIKEVDIDGDGKISFDEFVKSLDKCLSDTEVEDTFKYFDKNDDGFISPEELSEVLAELESLGQCKNSDLPGAIAIIKEVDIDGDGKISLDEFKKVMNDQ